jgi:hypothetical protein
MAWGVSVQPGGGALDAFTIFTEEGLELRTTTQGQRDTTTAARAKGEAARATTRAKEEKGRVGGPPPGFKPKGERATPAKEEAGRSGPTGRRRQVPEASAAGPRRRPAFPQDSGSTAPTTPGTRASQTLSK